MAAAKGAATVMKPVQTQITALFGDALRKAFPSLALDPKIGRSNNAKNGDFQCNNALQIARDHGKALGFSSPKDVGEAIKAAVASNDVISAIEVAPAGFINIRLSDAWVASQVTLLLTQEIKFADPPRKRVVVDFSSPNIAKEMHVGHLRSTIIGEATCRVLEFSGHEVHRLNHVGDWGTQFGMLIEYMKETFPNFEKELPNVSDLQEFYKASKKRFDEDAAFKTKAQKAVVGLQAGDKPSRLAWQRICDVSRQAFQKIYTRLDIVVEERGESFYNSMIPGIVEQLKQRGLCVDSDGAMCIFTPRVCEIPLMAVKSDGGYGYDSTDLAAIYHRLFVMRADWIVYITDLGQESHFHMIFDAAEQAGWHRPGVSRCDHMGFGVVQGDDKKKFKTRSGEVVKLNDLLDEAAARALVEVEKRCAEQEANEQEVMIKTPEERKAAANNLGIAAVRYFDMKQNRTSPYVFNYDRMLDPKGNTAVYLYYAYVRLVSIQRKAGQGDVPASELKVQAPEEHALAKKLCEFPDVIEQILATLHLHLLTDYIYQLCGVLTTFITQCRVVGADEQNSRLCLLEASRKILHKSFFLLGFTPLERI